MIPSDGSDFRMLGGRLEIIYSVELGVGRGMAQGRRPPAVSLGKSDDVSQIERRYPQILKHGMLENPPFMDG